MTALIYALVALAGYFVGRIDTENSVRAVWPFLGFVATLAVLVGVLIAKYFWR